MNEKHDIFLRAHPVIIDRPKDDFRPRAKKGWAKYAVVLDSECRVDAKQELTFGFYRVLELKGAAYELFEEGAFFDDDLPARERKVLEKYVHTHVSDILSFPPRFPLHSRSDFIKKVFYKYARKGAMITGFHIGLQLTRFCQEQAMAGPQGAEGESPVFS